jgi:ethanolamine utilization protein EutN
MQLARVIGTVVATVKDPSLHGLKILMIQPLTDALKPSGGPIAAIDTVQAGPNDLVHWITAREAALALPNTFAPVDAAITGIVDDVNIEEV